jgi:hypothetical protein
MNQKNTRMSEYYNKLKRDYIKENLIESYKRLVKGENINLIIRQHKKLINQMELNGKNKNKYKTINLLTHYKNTSDKTLALITLTNALNNKGLLANA